MNILVRLPNWLGDLVMSSAFVHACAARYPGSQIDAIVKKEHSPLMSLFGPIGDVYAFERGEATSIRRLIKFGRSIAKKRQYDLLFCLPGSFSSALGGLLTRSRIRIGYKGDLRSPLLTHSYPKPLSVHRAGEYLHLLNAYAGTSTSPAPPVCLDASLLDTVKTVLSGVSLPRPWILFNPNSEARSRRIPLAKAAAIADRLLQGIGGTLVLPGAGSDRSFTQSLRALLSDPNRCLDAAGTTDCLQLAALCGAADLVVSTDSGVAHLAAALNRPVVVLFGAGDPAHTAPLAGAQVRVLRAPDIPCAPCVSNKCAYPEPPCIMRIDEAELVRACQLLIEKQ